MGVAGASKSWDGVVRAVRFTGCIELTGCIGLAWGRGEGVSSVGPGEARELRRVAREGK